MESVANKLLYLARRSFKWRTFWTLKNAGSVLKQILEAHNVLYNGTVFNLRLHSCWPLIQKATKAAAVDRLTDTSKYTGSHKERFDTSGKGRGKAGREDAVESSGYVGAYKGSGTYDEKVKNA